MSELYHAKKKKKDDEESSAFGGAFKKISGYTNKTVNGVNNTIKTPKGKVIYNTSNSSTSGINTAFNTAKTAVYNVGAKNAQDMDTTVKSWKIQLNKKRVPPEPPHPSKEPVDHNAVLDHNPPKTLRKRLNGTKLRDIVSPKKRR